MLYLFYCNSMSVHDFYFCFICFFFLCTMDQRFQVPTDVPRKDLFFNVVTSGKNRTLTLEGGGVNATVVRANLAATNGIIHIIDHVLGIPSSTVDRKLATDPTLK